MDAVQDQLEKGTVEKVALCIFECDKNEVLERWTFDLRAMPVVDQMEMDIMFESTDGDGAGGEGQPNDTLRRKLNVADLEAQFRAVLSRLNSAAGRIKALPEDREYSFTMTIEVKENADRPVGRLGKEERKWVAAEPENWADDKDGGDIDTERRRLDKDGKTVPVRRLEAGELRMEVWVEESKTKFDMINDERTKVS